MTIDQAVAKARLHLEHVAAEAERKNIAAWRARGHSEEEVETFLAACREWNALEITETLEDMRATMELELARGPVLH